MFNQIATIAILLASPPACAEASDFVDRFEQIPRQATPEQMYSLLFALPKRGDPHHHNGLSVYASVWYTVATSPRTLARNSFNTLTDYRNCPDFPENQPRFLTIQSPTWNRLSECGKSQFQPLAQLTPKLKVQWLSSLVPDQPGEGRDEFFGPIVGRLGDLIRDPYLVGDAMAENLKFFGAEGLRYIEARGFRGAST